MDLLKISNICQICGKIAVGYHYGAYVCEACKKFFVRHSSGVCRLYGRCQDGGKCDLTTPGRGKCQHCRFRKCKEIGMSIKYKSSDYNLTVIPCQVCGAKSSGLHFGCITCEGCKGFFRRMVKFNGMLLCFNNSKCQMNSNTRSACKSCRLERCIDIGMSRNGIRIGRHPNALKYSCINSMKSENLVIEDDDDNVELPPKNMATKGSCGENEQSIASDNEKNNDENTFQNDVFENNEDINDITFDNVNIENIQEVKEGQYDIVSPKEQIEEKRPPTASVEMKDSDTLSLNPDLLLELEEHITQIIDNISPSSVFLTSSVPIHHENEICTMKGKSNQEVWSEMMDHFLFHSQFIVKFAKLLPGFSKLSHEDKKVVIKDSMYPMMMLELSQDFYGENGDSFFNYFDFSPSDRIIIHNLFPEFIEFSNHLKKCGSIKTFLMLDGVEMTLLCGIIIFYNFNNFSDRVFGKSMVKIYQKFLLTYYELKLGMKFLEAKKRKDACLEFINVLNEMNQCHHNIISEFCAKHQELQYPDLYIEMFN